MLRLWKRVRPTPDRPGEGAAALSDHRARVELFAALLIGPDVEVKPAEGAGGLAGQTLLLPRCFDLFDGEDENALVYLYRVGFAAATRDTAMDHACARGGSAGALASLLAVPAVLHRLHDDYPGTVAMTERLAAAELGSRTGVAEAPPPSLVEALIRARLRDAAGLDARTPKLGEERWADWLARALAVRSYDPEEIRAAATELERDLRRLGLASEPLPEVSIWGRAWAPGRDRAEELDADYEPGTHPAAEDRNIIELERTIRLRRSRLGAREDKPLFHVFEKLETAEDYAGQDATPDASGDVGRMKDAIDELSLGTAIRTTEDPRNLVRAEVIVEPNGLEVAERVETVGGHVFRYPEWHHRQRRHRADWVTLTEERYVAGDAGRANAAVARTVLRSQRRHVEEIRGHLIRTLRRSQWRRRQLDGPEIDINAVVERHADLVAGHTPSDRLYLGARRALREIAILVLVDTSFSTDAWIEGRRVLDVEIESLLILSGAFEGIMEEEVAVASFHSHTRNDVRFGVLKGFRDSWADLRRVAPGLHAEGYTRIGAAIRHATATLDEAKARRKLLLIVSDGKPTDYDRYEGRYGVGDVSMAVREAQQRQIRCFGLAVEKEAKRHLAQMLGPGRYRILPRTEQLSDAMAQIFVDLVIG